MTVAFERYDASGTRENSPRVCVEDLNGGRFEGPNRWVSFDGIPYAVVEILHDVEFEQLDEPVDIVKVRRKPN